MYQRMLTIMALAAKLEPTSFCRTRHQVPIKKRITVTIAIERLLNRTTLVRIEFFNTFDFRFLTYFCFFVYDKDYYVNAAKKYINSEFLHNKRPRNQTLMVLITGSIKKL